MLRCIFLSIFGNPNLNRWWVITNKLKFGNIYLEKTPHTHTHTHTRFMNKTRLQPCFWIHHLITIAVLISIAVSSDNGIGVQWYGQETSGLQASREFSNDNINFFSINKIMSGPITFSGLGQSAMFFCHAGQQRSWQKKSWWCESAHWSSRFSGSPWLVKTLIPTGL